MAIFDTARFTAQALLLKSVASRDQEQLAQITRGRLETLVAHARRGSKFWREKFRGIGKGSFSLSRLPTTTKAELMERFDESVTVDDVRRDELADFMEDLSNVGKYFRGKYAVSCTSGSQGQPLLLVQTKDIIDLLFALHISRGNNQPIGLRAAVEHILRPARLAVIIFKPGYYASASAFSYLPRAATRYLQVKQFCWNDENLIEQLAEFRPTHLTAYSSMLHEIARQVEAGRLSFQPELQEVVNIAERILPQARQHYTKLFGAPVLDNYAMGECLFITNACPTSGGMHVNADWAVLEVVDNDNRAVPAGEKGAKVLVTNLANYAQPIIRYEIGDIVTMATEPCHCGSNLPLVQSVEGRDSEMFEIQTDRGARLLQPMIFQIALARILEAREYQIIQEENTRFRILIEPLPGQKFDRRRAQIIMDEQLRRYGLDHVLDVELEVVERLIPDGDQKFQRVVIKPHAAIRQQPAVVSIGDFATNSHANVSAGP
jgi:phenylacetate-coenzyme A ligase PaaK-like adenylate-forming protein